MKPMDSRELANRIARRLKIDGWIDCYSALMFEKLIDTIEAVMLGQLPVPETNKETKHENTKRNQKRRKTK